MNKRERESGRGNKEIEWGVQKQREREREISKKQTKASMKKRKK